MTDQSIGRGIREMMKDPALITELVERWRVEKQARNVKMFEFRDGETFKKMVAALAAVNGQIDSETFAYFPERAMASAGWSAFTIDDVTAMFDMCSDPRAEWVDPGSVIRDAECPFPAFEYTITGLRIGLMTGQGTAIVIRPYTAK